MMMIVLVLFDEVELSYLYGAGVLGRIGDLKRRDFLFLRLERERVDVALFGELDPREVPSRGHAAHAPPRQRRLGFRV